MAVTTELSTRQGKFLEVTQRPPSLNLARIPIDAITILRQVRQTYDGIPELADSLVEEGLKNPLNVNRLDEDHAKGYLKDLNGMWRTNYRVEDLTWVRENGEYISYPLIAGHRRLTAFRLLDQQPCSYCLGQEGGCLEKHWPDRSVDVELSINKPFFEAFRWQSKENMYHPVPPHEDAEAIYYYFLARTENGAVKVPLTQVAREVGRSWQTVKNALRYELLPNLIQRMVKDGSMPYGVGCDLGRLKEELKVEDGDLLFWAQRWGTGRYKAEEFGKVVAKHINSVQDGQADFFGLFAKEDQAKIAPTPPKLVAARNIIMALAGEEAYLNRINSMIDEGVLGGEDSPYSLSSPIKRVLKLAKMLKETTGKLEPLAGSDAKKIRQSGGELDSLLKFLKEAIVLLPEESIPDLPLGLE